MRRIFATLSLMALALIRLGPAVPLDPIAAIVDAFQAHAVVALGEGEHGNRQGFDFRLALIRDGRFIDAVNDIVVESGNARYQDTIDRFVQGADVPHEQLRKVWENTTQPFTTFDGPTYRQFFEAVRSLNAKLAPKRRLRVLLGDPPIDWEQVHSKEDLGKWLAERDRFPADLIRREVLARHRRALVVYGDMHLQRRNVSFNYSDSDGLTIVGLLEGAAPRVSVFNIWTNTSADLGKVQDVSHWPTPSLALTKGTPFGAQDFTFYYRFDDNRVQTQNGALVPIPREQWRTLTMADQFDAVLYLGAPSSITKDFSVSPELCRDPGYLKMRTARLTLVGMAAAADRLKNLCATLNQK